MPMGIPIHHLPTFSNYFYEYEFFFMIFASNKVQEIGKNKFNTLVCNLSVELVLGETYCFI
jgi:hypothetical protein